MFKNRYWREYPWGLQALLFILMIFTLASFFFIVSYLVVPLVTGVTYVEALQIKEDSPRYLKDAFLFAQALSSIGVFLVPAVLFAYMAHPRPAGYLGLRAPGRVSHWLLVPLVMLGAMPVLLGMEALSRQMSFGGKVSELQSAHDSIMKALLDIHSIPALIKSLLVLSVVPAVSEELLFRGAVMRLVQARSKRIHVAIAISAFVFALAHYNPSGLFAIFFAGLLLAGIYYLTGSLWASILGHFLFNAFQITLMYIGTQNVAVKAFIDGDSIPLWLLGAGVVLFAGSFYLLWRNRTPLPDDWSDDFKGEERMKNEEQEAVREGEDERDQLN